MRIALAALIAVAALGGCNGGGGLSTGADAETAAADDQVAPQPVTPNPASGGEDTCGLAQFAGLIGQPQAAADRSALPPGARVITPETMVTQDYRPDRLNVHVSTEGRVSSLRCG